MKRAVPSWSLLALLIPSAAASAAPGDTIYAHPQRLVSAGDGARLNFICLGAGSPAVVFESTFGDWSPAWAIVLPRVAAWTRACVYDHAGEGFSDPGPMPRTNVRVANELNQALHSAGIEGPYILVGNASGGYPARTFAQMYVAETAGLVLVEPDVSDLEPKALQDEDHAGFEEGIAELRKCREAVAAGGPLPSWPSHPNRTCAQRWFFRDLPEPEFSSELNAALLRIAQSKVALYDAALSEWEQVPQTEAWLQQHNQSLGSRPIRVLTTGNHAVHSLPAPNAHNPKHLEYEHQIELAQARLLTLSSNAKQIFVPNSSEYVGFDDPGAIVGAIRAVYNQSRATSASTHVRAQGKAAARAAGTVFRDCRDCPEMVVVPAGSFTMGSLAEEKSWAANHGGSAYAVADEAPQHHVSMPSFALGKYDVTRGEYAAFVRETGHPAGDGCGHGRAIFKWEKDPNLTWKNPGQAQTDRDPVVCASWHDARAYITWLNLRVHRDSATSANGSYRLPSEAEWEYAARAATTTKFYWGDDDAAAPVHAWFNVNSGCQSVDGLFCDHGHTHLVGARPPNPFGLYDMAGNVWQWTEDCYDNSYAGSPADGSANETASSDPKAKDGQGNCLRVDRGGSWMFPAWLLRPATRERNPADYRNDIMGFRVARTLP